ncbi:hypothetical protein [Mesorhizobium onobrychidis]|uniref:hypothetical protein n=1 Tax=Mesorhizobium onobrychidis TaxID=2775404 RepID=UPI002158320F|nr:hypothetical protein [Mesorhizobium onobrychidis]
MTLRKRGGRKLIVAPVGQEQCAAKAETISHSYVNRLLQLMLLSPAIVETVLDGRQPATMTTADLLQPVPGAMARTKGAGMLGPLCAAYRPLR